MRQAVVVVAASSTRKHDHACWRRSIRALQSFWVLDVGVTAIMRRRLCVSAITIVIMSY